jgi:hypothetical protein
MTPYDLAVSVLIGFICGMMGGEFTLWLRRRIARNRGEE